LFDKNFLFVEGSIGRAVLYVKATGRRRKKPTRQRSHLSHKNNFASIVNKTSSVIILYHDRENNIIDFRLKSSIFFKDNDLLITGRSPHFAAPTFWKKQYPLFPVESKHFSQG